MYIFNDFSHIRGHPYKKCVINHLMKCLLGPLMSMVISVCQVVKSSGYEGKGSKP